MATAFLTITERRLTTENVDSLYDVSAQEVAQKVARTLPSGLVITKQILLADHPTRGVFDTDRQAYIVNNETAAND